MARVRFARGRCAAPVFGVALLTGAAGARAESTLTVGMTAGADKNLDYDGRNFSRSLLDPVYAVIR